MSSTASLEAKQVGASSKLEEALRELIREELQSPQQPAERPKPVLVEILWVGVVIANLVLLIVQVSDAVPKDSAFDFAFKIVGSVSGGSLVVYASWAREELMRLARVRWFQATQIALLILLISLRINLFPIAPILDPPGAHLFVDEAEEHIKRGEKLSLRFASHAIKILPPEGGDKVNTIEVLRNEFPVTVADLMFGAYRGPATHWSPLYPLSILSKFPDSTVELTSKNKLPPTLADVQSLAATELSSPKTLQIHMADGAADALVFVPVGDYELHERRPDGNICSNKRITVKVAYNDEKLTAQSCPDPQK